MAGFSTRVVISVMLVLDPVPDLVQLGHGQGLHVLPCLHDGVLHLLKAVADSVHPRRHSAACGAERGGDDAQRVVQQTGSAAERGKDAQYNKETIRDRKEQPER